MTETEWLESSSPEQLLIYLGERASRRKRLLLACACVRRIWPLLDDERLRQAIKVAERCAEGLVVTAELETSEWVALRLRMEREAAEQQQPTWMRCAARAAAQAVEALLAENGPRLIRPRDIRHPPDVISATRTARSAARAIEAQGEEDSPSVSESIRGLHTFDAVELVREIFGNPFRPPIFDSNWLGWRNGLIPKMAGVIYRKRGFRHLPFLADTLEEAGCSDPTVLTHCREPVEHVRGCWVIDFLLGMA